MNAPRFRIAWVMVAVAIAALDFGAIRAGLNDSHAVYLLILGALPMANVLAVGLLFGLRRPGIRPFLLGFEAFGALALVLYVAFVCLSPNPDGLLRPFVAALVEPMTRLVEQDHPSLIVPIIIVCDVAMLGWPQLAFAVIGGFLSRRFKIAITPR